MKKRLLSALLAISILCTASLLGVSAAAVDSEASETEETCTVTVLNENSRLPNDAIIYVPDGEIKAGFVFYPGGAVDYRDYGPLLTAIASQGNHRANARQ